MSGTTGMNDTAGGMSEMAGMRGGDLTLEDYARHVGTVFTARDDAGEPVAFTLTEAVALRHDDPDPGRRAPFSLVFGTPDQRMFEQRIIGLDHPDLGILALFLGPIGRDASGTRYEAVFN